MTRSLSPLDLAFATQDKGMLDALGVIESQQTERNAWLLRAGEQAKRLNAESKFDSSTSSTTDTRAAQKAAGAL